jgi:fumarylacetoacetate (FAA) hydrolase
MKLGTLKDGSRDGTLIVVSKDLKRAARVGDIVTDLRTAIEDWDRYEGELLERAEELEAGRADGTFNLDVTQLASPMPRAFQFLDGSAYLAHVERVRRARGAEMPPSFRDDPLMYQAVSDGFLPPCAEVLVADEAYGIDFEAEIVCVTDDVPMGVSEEQANGHIRLIGLINDVSLRNLIPAELAKGFGFLNSKPRSSLSPVFVTPDELGSDWKDGVLSLPLISTLNGERFGEPEAGEDMQFSLGRLIAHGAMTRPLSAGTIVGTGTIANQDEGRGASCLAERRMLEIIADGEPKTPFMSFGDTIRIEMFDRDGESIFGAIDQRIAKYEGP